MQRAYVRSSMIKGSETSATHAEHCRLDRTANGKMNMCGVSLEKRNIVCVGFH